ncbi:MAG: response regulator [Methylibium sp.]|uniref:hybrid sensor histidine kinase/response regulator n=1 Tax=Methylibium sp. TaxID=2067992 RepID=UPI0017F97DF7|nr:ATP-binding protein [Methylibium sp.]MBA3597021.1 response regulator [Methylibium sp.]
MIDRMLEAMNPAGGEYRRKDERLRALATTTLAIVWTAGPDGVIHVDNPSWAAFTGQSRASYEANGWLDALHPDDRSRVVEAWRQAVTDACRFVAEYRLRRHDGQYREVAAEGAPVFEDGRLVEWVGYCVDITERRRAEELRQESESHLRFLDRLSVASRGVVDATEVMGITARLLGEHLGATRTAYADVEADSDRFHIRNDWAMPGVASSVGTYSLLLFGPQAVANLHKGINLVVGDVDRELGDEGGALMFNAIGIKAIICAGLVKDERLVAMMAVHQSQPRLWTDNEVAIVSEVVERCWAHIERVRDTAKLLEQDRRKDEFLATLAHELRNPLAPMRYANAILRKVPPGSNQALRAQAVMERQVSHMARLVDDLLDLSRVNNGLITLKREPVTLRSLMQQAVETVQPALEAARHTLDLRLPAEDLVIEADPARIVQVIGNLLSNSAKYTPDGGHIRLAARRTGERVAIEVSDNGIGIPPEQQGQLFQMFARLQHSADRSQGGLGIGLALVKTLVQLHGGDVKVFSKGIDEGTTFTIDLPLQEPLQAVRGSLTHDEAAQRGSDAASNTQLRVLAVEDNVDGLASLLVLLETMGFEASGAADGESGILNAASFRPDVVLLDLGLPGIDGFEVARRLRADPAHASVKLIAVTGWGADADRRRTMEAGFDCHLTKPVEPEALGETVSRLAAARG